VTVGAGEVPGAVNDYAGRSVPVLAVGWQDDVDRLLRNPFIPKLRSADTPPSSAGRLAPTANEAIHSRCRSVIGPVCVTYTARCTLRHRPETTL
jgi:hypothetical protein